MTGPICRWCGHWLISLGPDHDEDECRREKQRETNRRGAAAARAAMKNPPEETP